MGHFGKVTVFHMAQIDHHVDLIDAVGQRLFGFHQLHQRGLIAVGKSNDCADFNSALHILAGPFDITGRDTNRCRAARYGLVT